tara:strand:- start:359 stop:589 length:231 start_codon:yes stop_codon:yes gene_type:complete
MKVGDLVLVQRASIGIPDGSLAMIVGEALGNRNGRPLPYFKVMFLTDKVSKLIRDLGPGHYRGYLPEHLEVVSAKR